MESSNLSRDRGFGTPPYRLSIGPAAGIQNQRGPAFSLAGVRLFILCRPMPLPLDAAAEGAGKRGGTGGLSGRNDEWRADCLAAGCCSFPERGAANKA